MGSKITVEDIDTVFKLYDKDQNGKIENEELQGFLKDLLELAYEVNLQQVNRLLLLSAVSV